MSFLVHAAAGVQPHGEANATPVEHDSTRRVRLGPATLVTFIAPVGLTARRFGLFRSDLTRDWVGRRAEIAVSGQQLSKQELHTV